MIKPVKRMLVLVVRTKPFAHPVQPNRKIPVSIVYREQFTISNFPTIFFLFRRGSPVDDKIITKLTELIGITTIFVIVSCIHTSPFYQIPFLRIISIYFTTTTIPILELTFHIRFLNYPIVFLSYLLYSVRSSSGSFIPS